MQKVVTSVHHSWDVRFKKPETLLLVSICQFPSAQFSDLTEVWIRTNHFSSRYDGQSGVESVKPKANKPPCWSEYQAQKKSATKWLGHSSHYCIPSVTKIKIKILTHPCSELVLFSCTRLHFIAFICTSFQY